MLLFGSLLLFWGYLFNRDSNTPVNNHALVSLDTLTSQDTLTRPRLEFAKDVQPILRAHCTPCHFPTGIMWIRMPFDDPQTLRDKSEAILKRIDDPEEAKKIREFLEQQEL